MKLKHLMLAVCMSALGAAFADVGAFSKKVTFTVQYEGAASISGIPVLVKLSAGSPVGFFYADCAADGSDIRFADANGSAIPFEIDTWNPSGESFIWVKSPAVTKGTAFTMHYSGTPAAANDPKAVWTEYTGVWHLNGLDADTAQYSQGLYPNATATAGIDAHLSAKSIPNETGKFGKAFRTNDSTGRQVGNWNEGGAWVVDAGTDSPIDSNGGKLTVSCWVKHNDWKNAGGEKIIYKRLTSNGKPEADKPTGSFVVEAQTKNYDFAFTAKASSDARARDETSGKDPEPRSDWVYVTAVFDSSNTILIYVNADHRGGKNYIAGVTDNDAPLVFGNNVSIANGETGSTAWSGWIDEVRYVKGAKSAEWIAAEYAAMASDSFLSAGTVVSDAPVIGEVTVTSEEKKVVISGTVASHGEGATASDVYLAYGLSPDALGAATKIATGVTDSFSYAIHGLSPKMTYFYELYATNNATVAKGSSMAGSFTTAAVFDYRRKVTFTVGYDAEGAGDLSGIPVLVKLSANSPVGFKYSDCAVDGSDIRFADANGEPVPFEIDTWNPSGESLIWVKAPSIAKGTTFTMYYKGTPKGSPYEVNDPKSVWAAYTGVWHLNGLGEDTTEHSQGIYANATATADIDAHLSANSIPNETGKFGKAFRTNDSTGVKQGNWNEGGAWVVDAGTDSPIDSDNGKLTVSCWVKHNDWKNAGGEKIIYKRMNSANTEEPVNSFAVEAQSKNYDFAFTAKPSKDARARDETSGKDPEPRSNWVYVTAVYDSSNTVLIYVNADHRGGKNYIAGVTDNDAPLVFGNNVSIANGETGDNAWNGWIDEVRYAKGAKSAAWIAAEYAAMTDDAFLTAGEVEKLNEGFIFIVR